MVIPLVAAAFLSGLSGSALQSGKGGSDCVRTGRVTMRVHELVAAAERASFTANPQFGVTDPDRWMDIQADRCPVSTVMGTRFFLVRNAAMSPATVYVVSVDDAGEVEPIYGFGEPSYARVVRRSLARVGRITDALAMDVARSYFRTMEGWEPGVVTTWDSALFPRELPRQERRAVEREASQCLRSIETDDLGTIAQATVLVFDGETTRLECVDVAVSLAEGIRILARRILRDRPRLSY